MRKSIFIFFFFITSTLFADWNQDFDQGTENLIKALPQFQNSDYLKPHQFFNRVRKKLLANKDLENTIDSSSEVIKRILILEDLGVVVKKRRIDNIKEMSAWELSFLLGSSECFVPSFPVEIAGKRVIIQKLEPLEYESKKRKHAYQQAQNKVSLESYWKAHIQAYLLGHSDLVGRNIGISPEGKIRFFDNESCFTYRNIPQRNELSFTCCYMSKSFDWPHYRQPIDGKTARALRAFVESFANFEQTLETYMTYRSLTFPKEDFFFRLQKVRDFTIIKGATFRDLFGSLFPKMNPGLEELNRIVRNITRQKYDHGSSLYFVCRKIKDYPLSLQNRQIIEQWIQRYVD